AVMAHAQIAADAELAQEGLTALHLLEARRSDRQAVLDPAGQTGCGRRVPGRETELARRRANLSLGKARFGERRPHTGGDSRRLPRTVLVHIIGIRPVADDRQPALTRERDEPVPQLGLTEEAAIRGIGQVLRIVELVGLDL